MQVLQETNLLTLEEISSRLKEKTVFEMLVMPWVHERFVLNHNRINNSNDGQMALQRQLLVYKKLLAENEQLRNATVQSHYKCLIEASIKGWSLDPADNQVYVLSYVTKAGNNAVLQPQAGAYVARLIKTGQIEYANPVEIVYKGDTFKFSNGEVVEHTRKFETEQIVAAYVKISLPGNSPRNKKELTFLYTPEDWNAWRKKSKIPDSDNWAGGSNKQPIVAFLKTKVMLHACKEKCWAAGEAYLNTEHYPDVITDDESADGKTIYADSVNDAQEKTERMDISSSKNSSEDVSADGEAVEW